MSGPLQKTLMPLVIHRRALLIAAGALTLGGPAAAVADLMFDLLRETGAALVMVTHDPRLAARADRQVRMAEGRVLDETVAA